MYVDEWQHIKPTDTHILWTTGSANFACLCGNYIVVSTEPRPCKLCGRVYRVDVRVLVRDDEPPGRFVEGVGE